MGAVAGNVKVGNRDRWITRWQALEYVTSQNLEKRAFDLLNCITVVPGALGSWRTAVLREIGGLTPDTVAEDADLTIAVRRRGWRIRYDDHAIGWTQAPEDAKGLVAQRFRWTFGTLQAVWKHRDTMLRPRYGTLGLVALPNVLLFQILLPVFSPIIDLLFVGSLALFGLLAAADDARPRALDHERRGARGGLLPGLPRDRLPDRCARLRAREGRGLDAARLVPVPALLLPAADVRRAGARAARGAPGPRGRLARPAAARAGDVSHGFGETKFCTCEPEATPRVRVSFQSMHSSRRRLAAMALGALVASEGCGGSGSGPSSGSGSGSWTAGVFPPSSSFANQCQSPRSGVDPTTGRPYADVKGTTLAENSFLRSWTNELYLWYREAPDRDPAGYSTTAAYFDVLKTTATTASGNPKDKFHFTYKTSDWVALSQSGVEAGYGAQWALISTRPPRQAVVAFTDPGTPATAANLARGAQVLTVDGVDLVNANDSSSVDKLNAGLFPSAAGESHSFGVLDLGAAAPRTVTMVSANVTSTPVQNVSTIRAAGGTVGYMLFNDHIATAEPLLVSAFSQLQAARSHRSRARHPLQRRRLPRHRERGGLHDRRSGPDHGPHVREDDLQRQVHDADPVTGQALTPVPFHSTTLGFSGPSGQALPTLEPVASHRAHELQHLLGQRVDRQQPARRGRAGGRDRRDHAAESRTASIPRTTAGRPTSRSNSRVSTTRTSATTRTASRPRTPPAAWA